MAKTKTEEKEPLTSANTPASEVVIGAGIDAILEQLKEIKQELALQHKALVRAGIITNRSKLPIGKRKF